MVEEGGVEWGFRVCGWWGGEVEQDVQRAGGGGGG